MKAILFLILIIPLISVSQNTSTRITDINKAAWKIMQVGENPDFIATDGDNAWVIDDHQSRILKISPGGQKPLLIVTVPEACTAPIVGFNAVWVMSCSEKKLYKIDHGTGAVLAKIQTGLADDNGEMSLATGAGSVWLLSDSTGILTRIDPKTNSIQKKITVAPYSYCAAYGHESIWITNYRNNTVQRINPLTNSVIATIPVGSKPRFLAAGKEGVWTLNQGDGTVSRIDPATNKLIATIDVHAVGGGGDIASGSQKVWIVSTNTEKPVQTINVLTNEIETIYKQTPAEAKPFKVDGAVRLSESYIWISGFHSKTIWVLKR